MKQQISLSRAVSVLALCLSITSGNAVLAEPNSALVASSLEQVRPSNETAQVGADTMSIWRDANILLKANQNSKLDLQVGSTNYSLYFQGLGDVKNPVDRIFLRHFSKYCSKDSQNESSNSGFSCQDDIALQHADINANSLVRSLRYLPAEEEAAKAFIEMLADAFPNQDLIDPKMLSPDKTKNPDTRKTIVEALARQATLSTAREALASIFARRQSIPGISGGPSLMQILDKEASQQFLNPAWQQQMQKIYKKALSDGKMELAMLTQISIEMASQHYLQYMMFLEMERNNVLAAASLIEKKNQGDQAKALQKSVSAVPSTSSLTVTP